MQYVRTYEIWNKHSLTRGRCGLIEHTRAAPRFLPRHETIHLTRYTQLEMHTYTWRALVGRLAGDFAWTSLRPSVSSTAKSKRFATSTTVMNNQGTPSRLCHRFSEEMFLFLKRVQPSTTENCDRVWRAFPVVG